MFSEKGFKWSSGWICLTIGLIAYIIPYGFLDKANIWYDILIKLGDVLVIGVVVGYVSNAAQFLGIFKKELQDIIYGREFLKVRNDIATLWETVTKDMKYNSYICTQKPLT